jgi:hypothetical protein
VVNCRTKIAVEAVLILARLASGRVDEIHAGQILLDVRQAVADPILYVTACQNPTIHCNCNKRNSQGEI